MKVDSLINDAYLSEHMREWANYRAEVPAPYNSMDSADDYQIVPSEDSEEEGQVVEEQEVNEEKQREFDFDKEILEHSPFRMAAMKYYPYK